MAVALRRRRNPHHHRVVRIVTSVMTTLAMLLCLTAIGFAVGYYLLPLLEP